MKILFIGDIVGEPGRRAVKTLVPVLRLQSAVDVVVANGENSAGGSGITPRIAEELFESGVDVITTGDHLWDQRDVTELLLGEERFLRPANYPSGVAGRGAQVYRLKNLPPFAVMNLQGRVFMAPLENPFSVAQSLVPALRAETKVILLDIHAEATSEKIALGRMLDGQVSAVIGTHTHVQTADEQVFSGGTAYLSDAGFTGPHESVLGRQIEPVIKRFLTQTPQRFDVARDRILLQGALIDVDDASGRARSIRRVSEALAL